MYVHGYETVLMGTLITTYRGDDFYIFHILAPLEITDARYP